MDVAEREALVDARHFAPAVENMLDIKGLDHELEKLSKDDMEFQQAATRDLGGVADIATIASALITLFMWVHTIRSGDAKKGASKDEITRDLTSRVLGQSDLPPDTKERLVRAVLDHGLKDRK